MAPPEAMQFGRAFQRVITRVVQADPRYGPVYLSKIDIADGFYWVWLQLADIPKLGVVLPTSLGEPHLIAFSLTLPMGWVESPPYFTVLTETACDLANTSLHTRGRHEPRVRSTAHRLEAVAATPPADAVATERQGTATRQLRGRHVAQGRPPVATVDVYVDDFLLMAQTSGQRREVMRAALTAIDQVFRPLSSHDPPHRQEPSSVKKMLKGDACWATRKRILGWDLDTESSTLSLPPHRLDRLYELLALISPPHKRVSVKVWHQLLGELRSMSPALPGARGLFSVLQESLGKADRNRVRVTSQVWDMAADFKAIADTLRDRPTRLPELVPTTPSYVGACDACQMGMGGVWFSNTGLVPVVHILWRQPFPARVRAALVTSNHPTGSFSISDLELAALVAHKDVLAKNALVAERTLWTGTDNRAALSWSEKGSSTSTAARAYLLRLNSLHQRQHRYFALHNHIAGKANVMADDASRLWHLSDSDLLSHFAAHYPQASPWRLLTLDSETNLALIGALFRQRPKHAFLASVSTPPAKPGSSGPLSATASPWTPTTCLQIPSRSCKSSPSACALAPLPPAVDLCGLAQWRTPFAQWARRTPGWGPRTLA